MLIKNSMTAEDSAVAQGVIVDLFKQLWDFLASRRAKASKQHANNPDGSPVFENAYVQLIAIGALYKYTMSLYPKDLQDSVEEYAQKVADNIPKPQKKV